MSNDDLSALLTAIEAQTEALQAHTAALQAHHHIAGQWGPIMAHPAADPVLSAEEAALYTDRHTKTLNKAAKAGELLYLQTREGGRMQYRLSALNSWLDRISTKPPRRRTTQRNYDI